jgi:hypothetical protein
MERNGTVLTLYDFNFAFPFVDLVLMSFILSHIVPDIDILSCLHNNPLHKIGHTQEV